MTKLFATAVTAALLLTPALAQQAATFQSEAAEKLFRQSRAAAGGEAAVTGVTSLVMKGTLRVSGADGGPPERAFEMRYLAPDQYLRIESAGAWSKRSGFSGPALLTELRNGTSVEKPPLAVTPALLRGEKARLARMLLGMASMTTPEMALTLRTPLGEFDPATNPGAPRVLQATAADGFATVIFYDAAGLPVRTAYDAGTRRVMIEFSDRRMVGGLLLPHMISTTLNGQPVEALKVTDILINAPLTKADFGGEGTIRFEL